MARLAFGTYHLKIKGISPLLMHNERLANPLSKEAKRLKALTGKLKKTDDDHWKISRAEFDGGLYINNEGPYVPDHWLAGMLRDGGKVSKLGKAVTQGVLFPQPEYYITGLNSSLPKAANAKLILRKAGCYDQRMAGNKGKRVLRTRPRFETWGLEGDFHYNPSVLDDRQITQIIETAGIKIGLGDYRPRFGRFEIVK